MSSTPATTPTHPTKPLGYNEAISYVEDWVEPLAGDAESNEGRE